jgi:hypothetical protein
MTETGRQPLVATLLRVRNRIQHIRDRKEPIGEQNTKAALIDPILSALGWSLEELDEVSREYRRKPQDNPVDYALFMLQSPRLFVEAKALEKDLNDRKWVSQTLSYATVVGVEWCVLTNGDEYRLYNAHAAVPVEEKLFRVVRLSDGAQDEYTRDTLELLSKDKMGENLLNVLWKAHFIDRRVKAVLDSLFHNEDGGLIRLIRKAIPELNPAEIRESLRRAVIRIDFPIMPRLAPLPVAPPQTATEPQTPHMLGVQVADLIQAGLINPPLELERAYKGVHLRAIIQEDGRVVFGGEGYDSLSTAAGVARKSVIGAPPGRPYPQTNGWTFWKYSDPETGTLEEIDLLRQRYLARNS